MNVSTPQLSASWERTAGLGREGEHRDRAAQPGQPAGRVAALGERDDVLRLDPLGDLLGGLGDHAAAGVRVPVDLREVPTPCCSSACVLGGGDDPGHRLDGVDGVLPHAGLAGEHHRVGAVEHRVGDVGGLGAGRRGLEIIDSSIWVATMTGLALRRALLDDLLLQERHLLERALHAEVAAGDHEAVEGVDDLVEVVDRLRLLDLGDDREHRRPPRA